MLVAYLSNGKDQDLLLRNVFYETIYRTTKFEFHKFTSTKENSAFLEMVKNTLSLTSL